MNIITCDICKKDLGRRVGKGEYSAVLVPVARAQYCGGNFYVNPNERTEVDICTDCSNEICEAQNRAVEAIKSRNN